VAVVIPAAPVALAAIALAWTAPLIVFMTRSLQESRIDSDSLDGTDRDFKLDLPLQIPLHRLPLRPAVALRLAVLQVSLSHLNSRLRRRSTFFRSLVADQSQAHLLLPRQLRPHQCNQLLRLHRPLYCLWSVLSPLPMLGADRLLLAICLEIGSAVCIEHSLATPFSSSAQRSHLFWRSTDYIPACSPVPRLKLVPLIMRSKRGWHSWPSCSCHVICFRRGVLEAGASFGTSSFAYAGLPI
jgi:hypothetical protein